MSLNSKVERAIYKKVSMGVACKTPTLIFAPPINEWVACQDYGFTREMMCKRRVAR